MDSLSNLYLALPSGSVGDWTVPLIAVFYDIMGGMLP